MKRRNYALLVLFFAAFSLFYRSYGSADGARNVTILHFNDLHGAVSPADDGWGGMVKLAAAIKKTRSERPTSLLLVSGDMITGSLLSGATKGAAIFRLAELLKIDAFVPGNHEFDYGVGKYLEYKGFAQFPFVAANMKKPGGDWKSVVDAQYIVFNAGGIKIAVVGIAHPAMKYLTLPKNTEGIDFFAPDENISKVIREADAKSDIVVALTHIGLDEDKKLAARIPGIDIIVGGHSHDYLKKPIKSGKTLIFQAGRDGRSLGTLDISVDARSGKIVNVYGKLIAIHPRYFDDPAMLAAVRQEEASLPIDPDKELGRATRKLSAKIDLAPWISLIIKRKTGADIGFVNDGGVRGDLDPGPITYRDVYRIMPFDNKVVVARVSGRVITRWMNDDDMIPDSRPKIAENSYYRVALPDFVASMRKIPVADITYTDYLVRDVIAEEIIRGGLLRK